MGEEILSGRHFWRNHHPVHRAVVAELVAADTSRGHRFGGHTLRLRLPDRLENRV